MQPLPLGPPAGLAELQDDYELLGELGRGGAAVVYRARDRALGRDVAIKVVHPRATAPDDDPVARLAREARTVAQLQHPNIVAVYAVRRLRGGGLALIMQFVPGATLKSVIQREGALASERVEAVLGDVGAALAYAHARGLVHRDVKPENIFLDEETGRALLADFGIARSTDADSTTMAGTAVGTPFYMSPEQVDGGLLDGRSDLYSLGLVAWEALTGRRPWDGESLYNVIYKQKFEELPPIEALRPGVPRRLQYLVERMLQKRPGARWAGAEGLLAQLDHPVLPADYASWQRALPARVERFEQARARHDAERGTARELAGPVAGESTVQFARELAESGAGAGALGGLPLSEAERARRLPWVPGPVAPAAEPRPAVADPEGGALLPAPGTTVDLHAPSTADGHPDPDTARPAHGPTYTDVVEPTWLTADDVRHAAAIRRATARRRNVAVVAAVAIAAIVATTVAAGGPAPLWSAVSTRLRSAARNVLPGSSSDPTLAGAARRPVSPTTRAAGYLTAGGRHTCALTAAGPAYCWGANERGQVGDGGAARSRRLPVAVAGLFDFERATSGFAHTCALTPQGDAYCWGANARGQLGDATTVQRNAPVRVAGRAQFATVAAGAAHSCAVTIDDAVHCWGANDQGQLGDGTRTSRLVPTVLRVDSGAVRVAAGGQHTCAVSAAGRLFCWGANADGQLGTGTPDAGSPTPRLVPLPGIAVSVSAGLAHTCAVTADGVTWCWGRNDSGQLGDGTRLSRARPTRIQLAPERALAHVVSGAAHTCGLDASGALWCWGRNGRGAVGDGSTTNRASPTLVRLPAPAAAVASGTAHTCATTVAGQTLCWGDNLDGQLGDNSVTPRPTPVQVRYPPRVSPRTSAPSVAGTE